MADCAIFVLWAGNKALMENRPDLGPGGEYFVFPGGKVRPGESHADAMIREALEEAGIRPVCFEPLTDQELWSGANHHSPKDDLRGWRTVPFLVTDWEGNPPAHSLDHQHAVYEWRDPRDVAGPDDGYTCNAAIARLLVSRLSVTS